MLGLPCHSVNKPGVGMVIRAHWRACQEDEIKSAQPDKIILGIRDPRGVIVSHYYMLLRHSDVFTTDNLPIKTYIERHFVSRPGDDEIWNGEVGQPGGGFSRFYRDWLDRGVDMTVRHEDLIADRKGTLLGIAEKCGAKVVGDVSKIVAKYATYTRAIYDEAYLKGKGQGGVLRGLSVWRDYLGKEELDLIYDDCGELMTEFGYDWP
jgi:hypothetical protein